MSSTFGGFNTVVRGLAAHQASLDTVGHNISNANTDGYSRQRVNLSTTRPQVVFGANGDNQLGTGVNIESVTRARDTFVDRQMWKQTSSLGYSQATVDNLGAIEGVFHEPSTTGVQTTMNNFWKSWQTLAANASDDGTRTTVRQRGVEMADAIQTAAKQLTNMVADTNSVIDIKVNSINQITSEMYTLNRQIVTIETGGMDHANDLRDRRDFLVDQLSKMVNVNIYEDKYGNYNVQSAGVPLVDGNGYQRLKTTSTQDPDYGYELRNVVVEGSEQPLKFSSGELCGLFQMRDAVSTKDSIDGIKGYIKKLDTMSEFLLKDFNEVHKAGLGTDNRQGHNFFGDDITDYKNSPSPSTTTLGWIAQLKVNPALFNPGTGLSMIAAKTSTNSLAVLQSNVSGGAATVNSSYVGQTPINYKVRIDSLGTGGTGDVTGVSVSLNDGNTWTTVAETLPATVPKTFQLPSSSGTVNIKIPTDIHNKKDDTYTFSVNQGNASGNNAVNLANCINVNISSTLGGTNLNSYYNSMIGALGIQSQSAITMNSNQKTLVTQVQNSRESVSGINLDEEMSNMIRFQKGYNAAARILTTMDEMLDKLINSTGVVGR